jgi:hypothetical protein
VSRKSSFFTMQWACQRLAESINFWLLDSVHVTILFFLSSVFMVASLRLLKSYGLNCCPVV